MRRWATAATLLVAIAAMLLVAPLAPEPATVDQLRVAVYASNIVFFGLLTAFVAVMASILDLRTRAVAVGAAISFALLVSLNLLEVPVASDVAKVVFGTLAGIGLGRMVERAWWLVPIALLVPLADAWSVFSEHGVTNAVIERSKDEPAWLAWPTIATPLAGFDYELAGRIGIVDVLFAAVFLTAAARWHFGLVRCSIGLVAGFVGSVALSFEGAVDAAPALPLLCLGFLVAAAQPLWRDLRSAAQGH